MPNIISITGQKGGVGKTTVCMGLAAVAAEAGRRVLVVDVDPQASASMWADRAGDSLPFQLVADTDPRNLARLREVDQFDLVFVDTPGRLDAGEVLTTVVRASDFAVLPLPPEPLALEPTVRTVRELIVPLGVPFMALINRVDTRQRGVEQEARDFLTAAGIPVFTRSIPQQVAHQRGPLYGEVITQVPADSRAAWNAKDSIQQVTIELLDQLAARTPAGAR